METINRDFRELNKRVGWNWAYHNRKVKILLLFGKGFFTLFISFPPELLCFRAGPE